MGGDDSETIREDPCEGDFHGPAFNGGFDDPSIETGGVLAHHGIFSLQCRPSLFLRNPMASNVLAVLIVPMKEQPALLGIM